jgi:hypothetical protein
MFLIRWVAILENINWIKKFGLKLFLMGEKWHKMINLLDVNSPTLWDPRK